MLYKGNASPGVSVVDDACEYCPERALSAALSDWMEELNQPLQAGHCLFLILEKTEWIFFFPFKFAFAFFAAGRQSAHTEQRSSAPPSRCKADRADCPSAPRGTAAVARLPVFPLNSGSPPSSPTGERRGGEKKRLNQSGQSHQSLLGSRSGATTGGGLDQKGQGRGPSAGKGLLSESQVRLLVGLHYLPHEHGPSAQRLLQDLTWLRSNCHLVSTNNKKSPPQKVATRFTSDSSVPKPVLDLKFTFPPP